ncbi:MAG: histidinol-phosphate transaminase [Oscillospiraceae bacterium]|nr:histidinol-phosphate transaminase [Oscillospiraceae bacterium]
MSYTDNLIKISPYTAGEQPDKKDFIKLNANENPFPPSPLVQEAVERYKAGELKRYPDANARPLCRALAERFGVDEKNVFCGNGSDDVLSVAFRAFFNSDKPIIFPEITYSFYPVWCDLYRIPYRTFPLNEDLTVNVEDFCTENGGVVLCNPNAPTSIGVGTDFVERVLKANPDSVVIVDEAYVDFGGRTSVGLLSKYDNLAVIQTFSKSRSMAGMRIGYCICGDTLMGALRATKDCVNSYPLDSLQIEAGIASVRDEEYFRATLRRVTDIRDKAKKELRELGFTVADSSTNFLFATHPAHKAADIYTYLKDRDIYVRHFAKPGTENYLRITVGTEEQTDKLIKALKELIKGE